MYFLTQLKLACCADVNLLQHYMPSLALLTALQDVDIAFSNITDSFLQIIQRNVSHLTNLQTLHMRENSFHVLDMADVLRKLHTAPCVHLLMNMKYGIHFR